MWLFLILMASTFRLLEISGCVMAENAHISFFIFLKSMNLSLNSSLSLFRIALYCSSTSSLHQNLDDLSASESIPSPYRAYRSPQVKFLTCHQRCQLGGTDQIQACLCFVALC